MAVRDKLFKLADQALRRQPVAFDLGGETFAFFLRELTGRERMEYERFIHEQRDELGDIPAMTALKLKLLLLCCVDAEGAKIFQPDDFENLAKLPDTLLEELTAKAGLLSGLMKPVKADKADDEDPGMLDDDDQVTAGNDDQPPPPRVRSKNAAGGIGELS